MNIKNATEEIESRRHRRFLDDVQEVEVNLTFNAKVVDESRSGIAISMKENLCLEIGQEISLIYSGAPMPAVVKNLQQDPDGNWQIGLEWKTN